VFLAKRENKKLSVLAKEIADLRKKMNASVKAT
jgi:hypothetical protein